MLNSGFKMNLYLNCIINKKIHIFGNQNFKLEIKHYRNLYSEKLVGFNFSIFATSNQLFLENYYLIY